MGPVAASEPSGKTMTTLQRLAGALILLGCAALVAAQDLLPLDHGLKYTGREGVRPVTVELTLREQPDGTLEYVEWTMPRGWARWFTRATVRRSHLAFAAERLSVLDVDQGAGPVTLPADLPAATLDELAVRLRARADIAQGRRNGAYSVWRADGSAETWTLEVGQPGSVNTPDGTYQALPFRLGTESEWVEGWSAPLLVFHFVQLEHWRDGRKTGELRLQDKQL